MVDFNRVGQMMRQAGADLGGTGLQFRQQQMQEQQLAQQRAKQLDDERKKALAIDARLALGHLEKNDLNSFGRLVQNRLSNIQRLGGDPTDTLQIADMVSRGEIDQAKSLLGDIDRSAVLGGFLPEQKSTEMLDARKISEQGQAFTVVDGKVVAQDIPGFRRKREEQFISTPPALLANLSAETATKADAAYRAAGGGKDGLEAMSKIIDKSTEIERRSSSPEILAQNFPKASQAELGQLQATMDAAKTTETGLKQAMKLRESQRRDKKAQSFQKRATSLLDSILTNKQLNDVLGSIEGSINFRFSDDESELIADIEEAQNILTADNMDLMSGVLSESDIALLKNLSSGALNRRRSPKRFVEDVTKLRDKLKSAQILTTDDVDAARTGKVQRLETLQEAGINTGIRDQVVQPQTNVIQWGDLN